jgi:putative FmdB family regulatory protein
MTYEYACTACGHGWEAEQSISAAPLTECPSCHQATAKRQVSGGAGFILKGGGWYSDLYASSGSAKGGKTEAPADKPKTESTTSSSSTSSDSSSTSTPAKTAASS